MKTIEDFRQALEKTKAGPAPANMEAVHVLVKVLQGLDLETLLRLALSRYIIRTLVDMEDLERMLPLLEDIQADMRQAVFSQNEDIASPVPTTSRAEGTIGQDDGQCKF
jgi:hypothetical protein